MDEKKMPTFINFDAEMVMDQYDALLKSRKNAASVKTSEQADDGKSVAGLEDGIFQLFNR